MADQFEQLPALDRELAAKIYLSIIRTLCRRLRDATQALKMIPDYLTRSCRNFENI